MTAAENLPVVDIDAVREVLRPIEGIVEVRLVGPHLWIIRDEVNVARDRRISHALGDLVDDINLATLLRAGMVPDGLRVL